MLFGILSYKTAPQPNTLLQNGPLAILSYKTAPQPNNLLQNGPSAYAIWYTLLQNGPSAYAIWYTHLQNGPLVYTKSNSLYKMAPWPTKRPLGLC